MGHRDIKDTRALMDMLEVMVLKVIKDFKE